MIKKSRLYKLYNLVKDRVSFDPFEKNKCSGACTFWSKGDGCILFGELIQKKNERCGDCVKIFQMGE